MLRTSEHPNNGTQLTLVMVPELYRKCGSTIFEGGIAFDKERTTFDTDDKRTYSRITVGPIKHRVQCLKGPSCRHCSVCGVGAVRLGHELVVHGWRNGRLGDELIAIEEHSNENNSHAVLLSPSIWRNAVQSSFFISRSTHDVSLYRSARHRY